MRTSRMILCLVALLFATSFATSATAADFDAELLADLGQLQSKIVGLAEAIPADKYSWRPAEGVRSVSEALMHAAGANFFFPSMLGVGMPEGLDVRGLEQNVTTKEEAVKVLKQSYESLQKAIEGSAGKLGEAKQYFGQDGTVAGLLHAALSHNHEHLGQMIAYARSMGVTPPWSG